MPHMDFVFLIVALVVGELVMWELPQRLAPRASLLIGIYVCLSVSLLAAGIAYVVMGASRSFSADAVLIAIALFAIMAASASAVLWYEKKKISD